MKYVIGVLVIALLIAHQDNWNWDNGYLVFGFMPIGMFFHVGISLAAGFVWFLACVFAWPKQLVTDEDAKHEVADQRGQTS